ncbi:amidohydrolase family protein [Mycoplasmopsis verecunda]|uniref:5-methylthioadenosine/S-adenosylhomocysteine deaminase n=1 Tax=Mycoplasmopsis verecunda TaxID=171291 RepID=A0A1T4LB05_9BACT|nr:amidohydrolase [Mycoplasmopsis verecunda]WPB54800.1 amidohydrolase [Mycoplasmopsis verecunda]SJZ51728.1 5-methylthioadenosine/S-adenosylhomocysteine deaminase [Mycoplasmopsis verecunda]
MKIWIKHATVVTMDDSERILYNANVYIIDKHISAVSTDIDHNFIADQIIDARQNVIMPGLINTHSHIPMVLLRNHANDVNLEDWLYKHIFPVETKLSAKDIYHGTRLGILEMISTGTTTFVDMYFHVEEIAKATKELKMRAYLGIGITKDSLERNLSQTKELFNYYKNDDLINIIVAPHAVYTNDESDLIQAGKLAKELGSLETIHLNESWNEVNNSMEKYNTTPLLEAYKTGNLTSKTIVAHAVHLNDEEIKLIQEVGCSLAHNPCSNLKLSSGIMEVHKLLSKGINVTLGTDGAASNNNLDMFEEMKFASLLQKGVFGQPDMLNAWDTLKMATVNGAKALHRENELGKIKAGYLADLIMVNLNNLNHTPRANIIDSLVYSTSGSDVMMTMINGEILYQYHEFKLADKQSVINMANYIYNKITNKE